MGLCKLIVAVHSLNFHHLSWIKTQKDDEKKYIISINPIYGLLYPDSNCSGEEESESTS